MFALFKYNGGYSARFMWYDLWLPIFVTFPLMCAPVHRVRWLKRQSFVAYLCITNVLTTLKHNMHITQHTKCCIQQYECVHQLTIHFLVLCNKPRKGYSVAEKHIRVKGISLRLRLDV